MLKKRERSESQSLERPNTKRRRLSETRTDFEVFGLSPTIQEKLKQKGITSLFEVQQKVFHPIYNGDNTIVAALTGSGKTLSFILPVVERNISKGRFDQSSPVVIVLAPTRELAIQIANEFSSLADSDRKSKSHYSVGLVYGGSSMDDQRAQLRRGVDVLVGTPGRIMDMIERKDIKLDRIKTAILDEADKMLEMGFQEKIEEIFNAIYQKRDKVQVCLFSATIYDWVVATAKRIMRNNEHTYINLVKNLKGRIPEGVENLAVNCLKSEKLTTIADLSILK